jgi:nucleotide-binding universal stress UspA family protein
VDREKENNVMTSGTSPHTIIVGVDGSGTSLAALSWAADLAGEDTELHVVAAGRAARERAELEREWLTSERVGRSTPKLHVIDHAAADVLTEFASGAHADLLVVGAHSGFPGVPRALGGVTHRLLHLSPCPIAVVRSWSPVGADAPVVVGVGHGPATRAALDWAADFSEEHDRLVSLVRGVNIRPIFGVDNAIEVMASYIDSSLLQEWARAEVDLVAAELRERNLQVHAEVKAGRPGRMLVDSSRDARVVVVGKHLDGPITGYLTGVTLHHLLTHAECPVVVVGPTQSESEVEQHR